MRFFPYAIAVWVVLFALPILGIAIMTFSPGTALFIPVFSLIVLTPSIPTARFIWWIRSGPMRTAVLGAVFGAVMQVSAFVVMAAGTKLLEKVAFPVGAHRTPLGVLVGSAWMSCLILGWWAPLVAFVAGAIIGHGRAVHFAVVNEPSPVSVARSVRRHA